MNFPPQLPYGIPSGVGGLSLNPQLMVLLELRIDKLFRLKFQEEQILL
jgi:hypothetical protein